jgi:hypothetical protein
MILSYRTRNLQKDDLSQVQQKCPLCVWLCGRYCIWTRGCNHQSTETEPIQPSSSPTVITSRAPATDQQYLHFAKSGVKEVVSPLHRGHLSSGGVASVHRGHLSSGGVASVHRGHLSRGGVASVHRGHLSRVVWRLYTGVTCQGWCGVCTPGSLVTGWCGVCTPAFVSKMWCGVFSYPIERRGPALLCSIFLLKLNKLDSFYMFHVLHYRTDLVKF